MSVREFVTLNQNNLRLSKTPLRYHPTDRMDKQNILQWDRLPRKTCYLDDIMKVENKKIGPQKYADHQVWTSVLNNISVHGSSRKGKTFHHDRVLMS